MDHELDHVLDIPPALDELGRQPIQKLGMRWPGALRAKIIHRAGKAGAKKELPEPVDKDARREGIFGRDDPPREVEPGLPTLGLVRTLEERRSGRRHDV